MGNNWVHNGHINSAFYAAESKTYTGPWKCWLDAESATKLACRVLKRMGEEPVDIRLLTGTDHMAGDGSIWLASFRIRLFDLCHEIAHIIHERGLGHSPRDGHDLVMWNLVALVTCVMSDVLDSKRLRLSELRVYGE